MPVETHMRCPVCRARFRRERRCPRCGADLTPLMATYLRAQELREGARQAICQGQHDDAVAFAEEAQQLCQTTEGRSLRLLARWLMETDN